jgi:outer membrane biosynthesis protein TonB
MSSSSGTETSLRAGRLEQSRLAWAFAISLALHLVAFGTHQIGHKLGVWEKLEPPAWMKKSRMLTELLSGKKEPPPENWEPPLLFVETSPSQAVLEAPKNAPYYSDKDTIAANPDADLDSNVPKLTGTQTQVPKTEDTPREKFVPLQPALPPEPVPALIAEETKPNPAETPGELTLAKAEPKPVEQPAPATQRPRPRTLQEARARQPEQQIPGERMKQVGGIKARIGAPSVDARATPFGAYDAAFIEAVSQRWFDLLESQRHSLGASGRVVLQFRLHQDGRISEMKVAENTVTGVLALLCQKAVLDPAPYATWPSDMRRMLGETRNIQFTFYYN